LLELAGGDQIIQHQSCLNFRLQNDFSTQTSLSQFSELQETTTSHCCWTLSYWNRVL